MSSFEIATFFLNLHFVFLTLISSFKQNMDLSEKEVKAMGSWWDDFKKVVQNGMRVVVSKTEEYTQIGKIKFELIQLQHGLKQAYQELGREVYPKLLTAKKSALSKDAKVRSLVTKIQKLEQELKDKEKELEVAKKNPSE